jgi:excisionase family DNA binding protein
MVESNQVGSPCPDDFLTAAEVAEKLRVSTDTVYRLIEKGKLKAINLSPGDGSSLKELYRIQWQWVVELVQSCLAKRRARLSQPLRERPCRRRSHPSLSVPDHLNS